MWLPTFVQKCKIVGDMKTTPLFEQHTALGARMCPFAGYKMPIQYEGIIAEHNWTRQNAGIFDVSHMGQVILSGEGSTELLGKLTPKAFDKLKINQCRYTVLTNINGGIIDDLIVTRLDKDEYLLVINAAIKDKDIEWIKNHLGGQTLDVLDKALIAIQGPKAQAVLQELTTADLEGIKFMYGTHTTVNGQKAFISRTGYTGEDGFEVSIDSEHASELWQKFMNNPVVKPIGLGARDSLRLQAGFPLYGQDLDETTTPVEADMKWLMGKTHTGYLGHEKIQHHMEHGTERLRVGIKLLDKGVLRPHLPLFNAEDQPIGTLTSGGYCPSLARSIGQAYVQTDYSMAGEKIYVDIRGRKLEACVCNLSFLNKE